MAARPVSLIVASVLLILIGGSGMAAGGGLMSVANDIPAPAPDVSRAALIIGGGIEIYGFAVLFAGVGLMLRRRWGWRVGLGLIAVGLVALVAAIVAGGRLDSVFALGLVLWGSALALLLAGPTRNAIPQ